MFTDLSLEVGYLKMMKDELGEVRGNLSLAADSNDDFITVILDPEVTGFKRLYIMIDRSDFVRLAEKLNV